MRWSLISNSSAGARPTGCSLPGMGLKSLEPPLSPPNSRRGQEVYAKQCSNCHKEDSQASSSEAPTIGYSIPPLWGDGELQCRRRHRQDRLRQPSYIRANMPFGINYLDPVLTVQQAWDVAAYMISKPHPAGDAGNGVRAAIRQRPRVLERREAAL